MRAAERISAYAGVDLELAEIVVLGAKVHHVPVNQLRSDLTHGRFVRVRRWVVVRARPRWSWWEIGRALNRDHSTVIYHHSRAAPAANDASLARPAVCGECDLRPDDPLVTLCTRTDCPLGHHRRRSAKAAADHSQGKVDS
jgi:hypothetical protein